MKDNFKALGALLLFGLSAVVVLGAIIGVILGFVYLGSAKSCGDTAEKAGLEHEYGLWTGCMVKIDGNEWIPLDKWRVIE